ncbi:hypothetical protein HMPREF0290_1231 [Corynebacterium efficiens YS-314]|uniref:hypothetical protein n=1 Tax=Corynebacterium efficiens TaxID=152794 RepID=UPI0001B86BBE|nr:hypothetical protein [Corynebacterium efficiens]EEW50160.1 hypothetical protein HMPREF0290_1231 [Corynebacterium efficiens YS-314]
MKTLFMNLLGAALVGAVIMVLTWLFIDFDAPGAWLGFFIITTIVIAALEVIHGLWEKRQGSSTDND